MADEPTTAGDEAQAPAPKAKQSGKAQRVYVGPATYLYPHEGAEPIGPGQDVSFDDETVARLTAAGHTFDPPLAAEETTRTPYEASFGA